MRLIINKMISEDILLNFGASLEHFQVDEIIFEENTRADFYYQLKSGGVKMFNMNESGKEFIQGFFYKNNSFGEPPLLANVAYPASAATIKTSQIYKLPKKQFFKLLENHPKINLKFTREMAKRLFYKAIILKEISGHPPEHRILTLIDYLKQKDKVSDLYQVELTRQQIADLTGLRVETVIRAVKQLEKDEEVKIIKRKVYR